MSMTQRDESRPRGAEVDEPAARPTAVFLKALLDAVPSPVFVVDANLHVSGINEATSGLASQEAGLGRGPGDLLRCRNALSASSGCGSAAACLKCVVRRSAQAALAGRRVVREKTRLELDAGGSRRALHVLVTASPFQHGGQAFALLLLEDIGQLLELGAMIPICSYCKKIRNDQQYWQKLEAYFERTLDMDFTHGICPDCMKRLERNELGGAEE
jgi:hypothetical protein